MFEKGSHEELEKSVEASESNGSKNLLAKESLRESEGLYKALLEMTTQGILIHDNGVIVETNPAFAKMTKYEAGDLIGMNVINTLALPEYRDLVREKMRSGFQEPYEIKAKRKDGIVIPIMILSAREVRYKNRILRIATIKDITEQKQTGKNLQRSEAFLNAIIENIPDMIFVKDADDFRFVLFNKAGEDLLGCPKDELIGKTDYDVFPEHEADFFRKKDQEVLESGNLVVIPEETIQTRDKGLRFITTKKIPIMYEEGKPLYLLGISEDLTDWNRYEEEKRNFGQQLQQAHKMEAIGTLAGGHCP